MMRSSSSSSFPPKTWKYDVFLSFRGEDTRKNFVDHLYSALEHHGIRTYKDDITLPRGDSIGPSLMKAIQESQIAVVIFSENYAGSSWCLEELEHIMKCRQDRGQIVLPVFYDVDPSDVRKQKRKYVQAFSEHESSENNFQKVESWRKALLEAGNIAGWETKHIANGHEGVGIKIIVGTILDKLLSVNSKVDENLVGMGPRFQYLESQLQIGAHGVRMIGIWGVGGGGKTTLAFFVYMKIRDHFQGHCFIGDIREESRKHGLQKQQEKVLSDVLKRQVSVASVHEGRYKIHRMLCRRNVLIVLDDVDDLEQLEALAGSHDWFGDGSRIIITTRNEQVLISQRVDVVCAVSLLSLDEAIRLFRRHAYYEDKPLEDYDKLSLSVIKYVDGLPLALKILGSFLCGKDKNEWISALDRLKNIPPRKVMDQLKISYDGLDNDEKDLFLDIACFYRGKQKNEATRKLDACGFDTGIGITVLIQKALLTISSKGFFDMHDLVQEMGHHIVRGKHPSNPEKHSRVWKKNEIESMFSGNATMVKENNKIEAIQYNCGDCCGDCSPGFNKLVSNMKKLRFLDVTASWRHSCDKGPESSYDEWPTFLSTELKYIGWSSYGASPFPESFEATKLVVLKLHDCLQKELWKGCKHLPCLKELEVNSAILLERTPDFGGLPCLQMLTLLRCYSLKDIDPSLGNHTSIVYVYVLQCMELTRFPTIVHMEELKTLTISDCDSLREFPRIEASMDSLVNLCLNNVGIEVFPSSIGRCCTNLISLELESCSKLKRIEGNFHALKHLKKFKLGANFSKFEFLSKDLFDEKCSLEELCIRQEYWGFNVLPRSPPHLPRVLRKLNLSGLGLKDGEIPCEIGEFSNLQELHLCYNPFLQLDFSLIQFTRLKLLNLSNCYNLVELPELPSNLSILKADNCYSLEAIRDDVHRNCRCLCQVSITKGFSKSEASYGPFCSFFGGERLLETMLQGKARCMSMELKGLEIPKRFKPRLVKQGRCRLKLPENWFNEFSGFLFCSVSKIRLPIDSIITMRWEEKYQLHMGMGDSQDEQVSWEESVDLHTYMGYVSFGLLRCTDWWDETFTAVDVSIDPLFLSDGSVISGFGARLVSKTNQLEETTTTDNSCADDDYTYQINILNDSSSCFKCLFKPLA